MKIGAAQTRPVKGDIERNIINHKRLIDEAVSMGADAIIFPELSLTGYEPTLAKELATTTGDSRLSDFQKVSNTNQITIGVGAPVKANTGVCIGMILFQSDKPRQLYSKRYLHPDEEEFFVSGQHTTDLTFPGTNIALAICFELSVPEHAENAFKSGADVYFASVAKFLNGMDKATRSLADIAGRYSMTALMSNSIGPSDNGECAGKTSVWNRKGELVGQLDGNHEGVLIFDTETNEVFQKLIK